MSKLKFKNLFLILLVAVLLNFQYIEVYSNELIFDGTQSNWAESEIKDAFDNNLTYPEIMNNYKKDITREEFSILAVKLYESLTNKKALVSSNPFSDTENPEILKAYDLGIINGISSNQFAPNKKMTRQEICVMIFRTLEASIDNLRKNTSTKLPFLDESDISSWALYSVKFAYQNGIMKGSNNRILPLDRTTRQEAIVLLKRTYHYFKNRTENQDSEKFSEEGVLIDISQKNRGLVKIGYKGESTEKVKVMIEKGIDRYVYPLIPNGKIVGFPLQMGNGEYMISILTNITDNRYAYIETQNLDVKLTNQNLVYLNSIQLISWNPDSKAVVKNNQLVGDETDIEKKVEIVYDFIINNVRYDYDKVDLLHPSYIPYPDKTIVELKAICYDYTALLAAMKRSEDIPVKLVKGYSTNVDGYHSWNEIFINGEWIIVDTTVDAAYNKAKMNFKFRKDRSNYTKVYEY